nr:immunoglobulin light chain junction region [Macaca mulatta]MPN69202.1 immunoglobulin light chain junction region [Macaca mulatta]
CQAYDSSLSAQFF